MSNRVQQLLEQIRLLAPDELAELETALAEKRWTDDDWDRQMRADAEVGKFDPIIREVDEAAKRGELRDMP